MARTAGVTARAWVSEGARWVHGEMRRTVGMQGHP